MFVVMFSCQDIDLIPVSSSVAPERLAQLAEFALFGFECLASGLTRSLPWRALGLRAEFIPLWFWVFGLRADTLSALACAWPTGRVHSFWFWVFGLRADMLSAWRALGLQAEFTPHWFWVLGLRAEPLSAWGDCLLIYLTSFIKNNLQFSSNDLSFD